MKVKFNEIFLCNEIGYNFIYNYSLVELFFCRFKLFVGLYVFGDKKFYFVLAGRKSLFETFESDDSFEIGSQVDRVVSNLNGWIEEGKQEGTANQVEKVFKFF